MDTGDDRALHRALQRLEAAELELERAHHLLDQCGVPREQRVPGERDPLELSLEGRLRMLLEDEE